VHWVQDGAKISLVESGGYPFEDTVSLLVNASQAREFALNVRIPGWAEGTRIEVNGKRWTGAAMPGTFATVFRQWRSGDRVDLELPRNVRLEPITPKHPDTVALLCGPLVLFAIAVNGRQPSLTRNQLLNARQTGKQVWEVSAATGSQKLLPYVAIDEEQYTTYLHLA
jgi:DUF1680 family protein